MYKKFYLTSSVALVLGSIVALSLFLFVSNSLKIEQRDLFHQQANSYFKNVEDGLQASRDLVISLKSFIQNTGNLNRQSFENFSAALLKERNNIQALQWIPRVGHDRRENFELQARHQGFSNYQIVQGKQGAMSVSAFRPEYYPVYYLYPMRTNELSIGYNLGSQVASLSALQSARDTGQPVMTAGVQLAAQQRHQTAVMIYYPVYLGNSEPTAVAERRRKLLGFATIVLRVGDLIEQARAGVATALDLQVVDLADQQLLYGVQTAAATQDEQHFQTTLTFAQRSWQLSLQPQNAVQHSYLIPGLTAIGAVIISLLVSLHFYQLNRAHHTISLEVARQTKALKLSEQRFALAVQGASVGIWDWSDINKSQLYWSGQLYRLLGYADKEIESSIEQFIDMLHPDDRTRSEKLLALHFNQNTPYQIEYRIRHKSGEYLWFLGSGQACWDERGSAQRMVGSIQKIDERKKAEIDIQTYAADLQRSNEDLEQFAYVASHDLKAPLRAIGNLALWIEEGISEHLDDETASYMQLLKGRITRLEDMLAGLLQYSKAGNSAVQIEFLDMNLMVENIVDLLAVRQQGFTVKFDLPSIDVQPALLNQVMHNLISNAIKHHHLRAGEIIISYRAQANEHVFTVSDNGPGIDPAMSDKVFQMFQTLKPRDEVEGSGMGLAVVKKLIERNGGRVWIEATAQQQGCCIKFTLPIAVAAVA
ncbi:MAG: CHASE domain-containing protein [Pseudomonadales bacterium]|nr:CHASE domain-containing protein [Pseudomonadales bacterium]NRA18297.1 CHASE domain-containing protein [Oceanospirillaceae bacterium]